MQNRLCSLSHFTMDQSSEFFFFFIMVIKLFFSLIASFCNQINDQFLIICYRKTQLREKGRESSMKLIAKKFVFVSIEVFFFFSSCRKKQIGIGDDFFFGFDLCFQKSFGVFWVDSLVYYHNKNVYYVFSVKMD